MKKKSLLLVIAVMLCAIGARAWTVQFTNPDNWEQVCVWAWDANNNNQNCTGGTWPGASMNKTGDVWTYTGNGTPTNILFNNKLYSYTVNDTISGAMVSGRRGLTGRHWHRR